MARRELIAAYAMLGALGGALFGYGLQRPHTYRGAWDLILALTVCTAISATLLGIVLTRKPLSDAHVAGSRATALSFVFGALNGVLMVVAMALAKGSPGGLVIGIALFGAMFGGVCALPFIPATVAVAVTAARATGRAGSIAGEAQRRRVLRVAALCLAIASITVPPRASTSLWLHVPLHVTNICLALIVALLFVELAAASTLRKTTLVGFEPAAFPVDTRAHVDFGLGNEMLIRRAHDETYRADVGVAAVVRGDRAWAIETVNASLRGHAIAAGIATASLVAQLAMHH
jgi:hypothetical protein